MVDFGERAVGLHKGDLTACQFVFEPFRETFEILFDLWSQVRIGGGGLSTGDQVDLCLELRGHTDVLESYRFGNAGDLQLVFGQKI